MADDPKLYTPRLFVSNRYASSIFPANMSFVLSGNDANFSVSTDSIVNAAVGAFVLTGIDAGLLRALKIAADATSFAFTGVGAGLEFGYTLIASSGEFLLSGVDTGLDAARRLPVDHGEFTLTGVDAVLSSGERVSAESATFTFTGNAAGYARGIVVSASVGTFVVSGSVTNLNRGRRMAASVATFTQTGVAVNYQVAKPYWRLVSNSATGDANLWDLEPNADAGMFESGDLTGTDVGAALTYANLKFFTSGDVETTFGTSWQGNPFASSGTRLISNTNTGVGSYLRFIFAVPRKFGSMKWYTLIGYPARQPSSMTLQYSSDGTTWTDYATLTNASKTRPATWQNIVKGGTHAST